MSEFRQKRGGPGRLGGTGGGRELLLTMGFEDEDEKNDLMAAATAEEDEGLREDEGCWRKIYLMW